MSGFNDLKAMLTSLFTQPDAYSRITRTPIYFADLGPDTAGVNMPGRSAIFINKIMRNRPVGEDIRHESAHELIKPILSQVAGSVEAPDQLKSGLSNLGYQGILPFTGPTNRQSINESLGYATSGAIPGLGLIQSREGEEPNINSLAAQYLRNVIGKVKEANPSIAAKYMQLMTPRDASFFK